MSSSAARGRQVSLHEVVIVSAVRTPLGSFRGKLAPLSAPELAAVAIRAAVERAGVPKDQIKQAYFGNTCSAGLGQSPAKHACVLAGLSEKIVCVTMNKQCSSGIKAVTCAAQCLQTGAEHVMLAGGMESFSNVPFYLKRGETTYGGMELVDGILRDGLLNHTNIPLGERVDSLSIKFKITRQDQDEYALISYKRAATAYAAGVFTNELVAVSVPRKKGEAELVTEDEEYKRVDHEKLVKLPPAYTTHGSITAGNASALGDGAAALVLMTAEAAAQHSVKPLARIIDFVDTEGSPTDFTVAPATAIPKLLDKTGINKEDIALWEINESFSAVYVANQRLLGLDAAKVNVHGGSVSLTNPLGVTGARLIVHLVHALKKGEKGVASAGGAGSAIMLERL